MKTIFDAVELIHRAKSKVERAKRIQHVHEDIEIIHELVALVETLQEALRDTASINSSAQQL